MWIQGKKVCSFIRDQLSSSTLHRKVQNISNKCLLPLAHSGTCCLQVPILAEQAHKRILIVGDICLCDFSFELIFENIYPSVQRVPLNQKAQGRLAGLHCEMFWGDCLAEVLSPGDPTKGSWGIPHSLYFKSD